MVWIEIDDQVWDLYGRSWALFGVKTRAELVRMLHVYLEESSMDCLRDAERHLISDQPEALFRFELGLLKERKGMQTHPTLDRWTGLERASQNE